MSQQKSKQKRQDKHDSRQRQQASSSSAAQSYQQQNPSQYSGHVPAGYYQQWDPSDPFETICDTLSSMNPFTPLSGQASGFQQPVNAHSQLAYGPNAYAQPSSGADAYVQPSYGSATFAEAGRYTVYFSPVDYRC